MSGTGFYRSYSAMKRRCNCEIDTSYYNYGGRGIRVCDRWNDPDNGFRHFKDDMYDSYLIHCNLYGPENTTIDRIDTNKDYSPDNCKWSTIKEQANNKRNNHMVEYNGEELTLAQCVEKYADCRLNYHLIKRILYAGWDLDKALHELPNSNNLRRPVSFDNK